MIVVDLWGGEDSMEHVARYMLEDENQAMRAGVAALKEGFLVNLRRDADFGPENGFDTRIGAVQ